MNNTGYGILVVVAGPSGAGKTTLVKHLVDRFSNSVFSVSVTTRSPRGGEEDGIDYFFVNEHEFDSRIAEGYFLEHADVHGYRYGTSRIWVEDQLSMGKSVILEIDVNGAMQISESIPGSVLIFVAPPNPNMLELRLSSRNTDTKGVINSRLSVASEEIRWLGAFDYFICNDNLSDSKSVIEQVFITELMKLGRRILPVQARQYEPDLFHGLDFWNGKKVIVTAGPTREFIDDIRFISNRSSGRMGYDLALTFRDIGSQVILISGPVPGILAPAGIDLMQVISAGDLRVLLENNIENADLLVMAAAVADFRPQKCRTGKISRQTGGIDLRLDSVPDILAGLQPIECPVLAFALEFGESYEQKALEKMKKKGADAVFVNRGDIKGRGMETPGNTGVILFRNGNKSEVPTGSKRFVAEVIAAQMGRYLSDE